MKMTADEFEELVAAAVASLPGVFAEKLDNVAIVVEEWPSGRQMASVGMRRGHGLLLGLYQGVAKTRRGAGYGVGMTLPDKITIFRGPIMRMARNQEDVRRLVYNTVLHEIGHHFGMSEEQIREALR